MTQLHRIEHMFLSFIGMLSLCVTVTLLRTLLWYVRQPELVESLTHSL